MGKGNIKQVPASFLFSYGISSAPGTRSRVSAANATTVTYALGVEGGLMPKPGICLPLTQDAGSPKGE